MPVKGAKALQRNVKRIFKNINDKKAPQFVNAVLSIGLTHSKELAPVEFSTLVNSAFTDTNTSSDGVTGKLTYNTSYAAALEFRTDWKPRPVNEKAGPATNMNAEPHYLKKGFEDPESRAAIKKAESIFKI